MYAVFIIGKASHIFMSYLFPFFLFFALHHLPYIMILLLYFFSLPLSLSLSLSLVFSCRLPGLVNIGLTSVYPNLPEYTDIIPPTVEVIGDFAHV